MAGLPVDVSVQLNSVAAMETLDLGALVTHARTMLLTRRGELACADGYVKPKNGCYNCGRIGHLAPEYPHPNKTRP